MSNKVVPPIYRTVIDDVIASVRPAFEEFGVHEDVLQELQSKWEAKVIASRVADFEPPQPPPAAAHHPYRATAPPALPHYPVAVSYVPPSAARPRTVVKTEPTQIDPRYALAAAQYALPPLPGPAFPGLGGLGGGGGGALPFHPAAMYRLPQTDGPAGSEDDDEDEYDEEVVVPRAAHPSLPLPAARGKAKAEPGKEDAAGVDEEAINSDLDDSDTENEEDPEEATVETDIVFCTYDRVARVKNKWKCVLKDGMIHTGGKDYLFQRCTGEFEW